MNGEGMVLSITTDRSPMEIAELLYAVPDRPLVKKVEVFEDGTKRLTFEEPLSPDVVEKLIEYGCAPVKETGR